MNQPAQIPIQFVVLDLDGTLIGINDKKAPEPVARAIRLAMESGVRVTLATGRAYPFTRSLATSLNISAPLICYQGAVVQAMDGRVLREITFSPEVVRPALALAQERNWQVFLEAAGVLYLETGRHYDDELFTIHTLPSRRTPDLLATLPHPHQFSVFAPDGIGDEEVEVLQTAFGSAAEVLKTHHHFVNAIPAGVSKGAALAWLAQSMGIPQAAVMAVGDSDNDTSMVEWAGLGVAMGNARPAVLAAADWVAPTMQEFGAAAAIHRFVLNGVKEPTS